MLRRHSGALAGLGMLAVVYATNNSFELDDPATQQYARDSYSYASIVDAAPALPNGPILFHHAQRLVPFYILGTAAGAFGLSTDAAVRVAVLALAVFVVVAFDRLTEGIGLGTNGRVFLMAMLVLNPYTFRSYVAFPSMLGGLLFVAGLCVLCLGLVRRTYWPVLAGMVVMSVARQTALLIVIPTLCYVFLSQDWRTTDHRRKLSTAAVVTVVPIASYFATAAAARGFALPSYNLDFTYGMVAWLAEGIRMGPLLEFGARAVVPFIVLAAVAASTVGLRSPSAPQRREAGLWLLFTAFIVSQPILAGPALTGGSIIRLGTLGLVPALLGLAILLRGVGTVEKLRVTETMAMVALIAAASFHHIYSIIGPNRDFRYGFGLLHVSLAIVVAGCVWVFARRAEGRTGTNVEAVT